MERRSLLLKNIPEDIFAFLLQEQNKLKEQRSTLVYSIERVLYGIIRGSERFKNYTPR